MIIDAHTQVFPPDVRDSRDEYVARDEAFRAVYGNASLPIATAEELLASMDEAGIDRSVVLGFSWSDAELCAMHSEYLLTEAAKSGGRLIPFCTIHPGGDNARKQMERYASRGARGLGELRPALQGYGLIDSEEADLLAWASEAYDLTLFFHASEPVGPVYPGKPGLPVEELGRFVADFPGVTVIAANWGAGLPFYALMPEVRESLVTTYFDTASAGFAYRPEVYARTVELVGAQHLLFGSGFPKRGPAEAVVEVRSAPIDDEAKALILGENAGKVLRL